MSATEEAIKRMVMEKHVPDVDVDVFEADDTGPKTSDMYCKPE